MEEILIVDDSIVNRIALTQILQDDYKVLTASSGKEMFHVLEETDPKLILLDIIMPDLDGFEVIAKLKSSEEYSKIPVIFITGLDDDSSEEKGFLLGAIDYITKPFKPKVVKARVRSYVQLYDFIRQTERLGQNDGLTGLYNKKMTEQQIKKQLSSNPPLKCGALMIIDVDNFKSVNDTFGHLYGDAVITQLGSALRSIFQKSDILGRVGGDEFFVFLRNYNSPDVLKDRAAEVCNEFRKTYEQNNTVVKISASIGIATTENSFNFEDIYKFADIALYNTKSLGKNNFSFYTGQELIAYKSTRTEIENNKISHHDPIENIKEFKNNLKEYMFNLVEGGKLVEYTIQSILQMICEQFSFDRAFITKIDYEETGIKCINNWISSVANTVPEITDLSFFEVTQLHNMFTEKNLVVSPANEHVFSYSIDQSNDKTICLFAFKNKRALMGYVGFEKVAIESEFNPKVISNIVDVCQQLSTVVINQFLLENVKIVKENLEQILDNIADPVYVTKPEINKPLFINKAAKETTVTFHGKTCFKPSTTCDDCILKNAINNGGFYQDGDISCREISWSNDSKAYLIRYHLH